MKIPSSTNFPGTTAPTTAGSRRTDAAGATPPQVEPAASGQASAAVAPGTTDVSAFDATKVGAIKQAIAEGRMEVDASVVADRLIAQALALSGRTTA